MMKNSLKFILVFVVGVFAGVCTMSFYSQSITGEKANSYYTAGLEMVDKDSDEAILMFVYSSSLKPDWYAPHLGLNP
jgi:hypothetical protein